MAIWVISLLSSVQRGNCFYICPSKFNTAQVLFNYFLALIFVHYRGPFLTAQQKVVNSLVSILYVLFAVVFYMLTQRRGTSGESSERLY